MPRSIRAGRAFIELFADDSRLVRGLRRAQARLRAFSASVRRIGLITAAAGAAIVAPMLAMTREFQKAGDSADKMAARTGESVEELSTLEFAASQLGVEMGTLESAILRMTRRLGRAADGTGPQAKALEELGLTYSDLAEMSPADQFLELSDALSRMSDPLRAAALGQDLFGTQISQLLPIMRAGSDQVRELQARARSLGLEMETETAGSAAVLGDALDVVRRQTRMARIQIGAALAPALTMAAERMSAVLTPTLDWIRANQRVVATVSAVGAGLIATGGILIVTSVALSALATGVGLVASVMGGLSAVLGILLTPLGAVAALATAAGVAMLRAGEMGGTVLAWLTDRWASLLSQVTTVMAGVRDALTAGEIRLAARVLWLGIRDAWLRGTRSLRESWQGLWSDLQMRLSEFTQWFVSIISRMWQTAQVITAQAIGGMRSLVEQFNNLLARGFGQIIAMMDDRIDPDAISGELRRQHERNMSAIVRDTDHALERANSAHDRRLTEAERRHAEAADRIAASHEDAIHSIGAEIDRTQRELADSIEQSAKAARAASDELAADPPVPETQVWAQRLRDAISGLDDSTVMRSAVRGTFAGVGIGRMLAGSPAEDRTAKNTAEIARYTKRMAENADASHVVFGA